MNIASLFNLAGPDLFVILIIVLLLFGARKSPELIRHMLQALRDFFHVGDEFEREVTRPPGAKSATVNRVLTVVVVISAVIFLCVLSSRP